MAMGPPGILGVGLAALNAALLIGIGVVWIRNYRQFRSAMLLGLTGFSVVLFLENVLAGYFFIAGMKTVWGADPIMASVVLTMRGLELFAIGLLAHATLR
ncbi:MAG: hypothetical protein J07HQW1_01724 [Haloquadratum walsbyi J07HQW1]|jgi:hypothetical protein|uniref:Uncharacterized protein n=1 Tax=Haloquadratum walsbyi J07HQW1 TaxID=1238424 RepID=U1N514_9EURY|nr:MAG: hypothetical protein J07HQW1_01724 [Haloquadratum walsbyi J07HQW1]